MKVRPTKQQREAALLAAGRIEQPTKIVNLAADGTPTEISDEARDQILAKCAAGEYVRLVIRMLAYEHAPGEPNRRFVKIRDGAVLSAARTAEGRPFLRDHLQGNTLARAGTILSSRGVRRGDGDYAIEMDVELTAPWAVDLALRGLLTFVSIGMNPTGPVLCSYCGTEVFTECLHLPGEEIVGKPGSEPVVCEWVFTSVEIVECSAVNVPAVPGAHIEGIRAALSAVLGGQPPEGKKMDPRLLALLGLAATASEADVLSAVEAQGKDVKTLKAELGIATKDLATTAAERDALKQAKLAADAKAFIDEAISLGKIAPADTETWSELYALNSAKAVELMAARKPGTATPVGAPRQTPAQDPAKPEDRVPVIEMGAARARTFGHTVRAQLAEVTAKLAADPKAMAFAAGAFGFDGRHGGVKVPLNLGATSITNNADLVASQVGFRAALLENVVGETDPLIQIATEVPSNRITENYKWLGDLPQMEEWKNDRTMQMLAAYEWAITNKKWQATLRVKNDDFRDDALGLLPVHVAGMGQEAALQPSMLVAKLLVNGFDGTAYPDLGDGLAFDGAFFFSAAHATGSNLMTGANSALSATSLGTAFTMLRQQQRFDGLNLYAKPTHLIVGVDLEQTAIKLLSSDFLATVFGVNTAAAPETNIYKGRLTPIVSPIIPAGHWFVADLSNPVKPMLFQNREGVQTHIVGGRAGDGGNDFVGFNYDETWFGAYARNNAGYWDFRRIIGATGS